jgi:predicted helicase
MKSTIDTYLASLARTRAATESTGTKDLEHQHRPALGLLLETVLPDVNAINEPGKIEFGAPDFALIKSGFPIGYVETKRLGENLADIAKGEQIKRYFGYANLILTNYLEFRFYKHGEEYADPIIIADLETFTPDHNSYTLLETTTQAFFEDAAEPVRRASRLAEIMGENGKRLRANLLRFLRTDSPKNKSLLDIYEAFKSQLIHDLTLDDFTDMYAQTLVYGLFVARYHDESPKDFTRAEARELIPHSNPLLRRFFDHIAGADFDDRLKPIVDDLCKVFGSADVRALMQQIYKQDLWGAEQAAPDPVIHFYEDFLKAYDPVERKKLGAYYTPPAVVQFIVRSVDTILKRDFDLPQGLADTKKIDITRTIQGKKVKDTVHKVQVLDPATGTGTFLNETVRLIRRSFAGQEGRFNCYINEDLLPRLHGFELMMAPYTIAHLKLGATLRESGAKDFKDRIGVYLTNSLEKAERPDDSLFGMLGLAQSISEESRAAARIKNDTPIMVVIGNPPYAGESSNKDYTDHDVYKIEPGTSQKLKERNSKWINDDYVKFIRFAESLIETTGEGIVGMITAHGYLDNPTFRGMRYHLMETFSEIYVLDLHGNSNKKEKTPNGGKDENVFAIKQGVGIIIGVRRKARRSGSLATIYRADCYGVKRMKFEYLNQTELGSMHWHKLSPKAINYAWVIRDEKTRKGYDAGFSLNELFPISSVGVVTSRDGFVIDMDNKPLAQRIQSFLGSSTPQEALAKFGLKENLKWKAVNTLKHQYDEERIVPMSYRPFDSRFIYYHDDFIERSRLDVMKHLANGNNIGLEICRQTTGDKWQHVLITDKIVDDSFVSNKTRERGYVLPLYACAEDGSRQPNLNRDIVKQIASLIGEKPAPEDIFDYIYAVLHSPSYREKYKEFLKIDFPRVPYPKDKKQFERLVVFGRELREIHLLGSLKVKDFITTYPVSGSGTVEKVSFFRQLEAHEKKLGKPINFEKSNIGNVYINDEQYFGDVPDVAWNFCIGGYQPAQKWLKDRKGRTLSNSDIEHYQKIIVALVETERVMKEIDEVFATSLR